MEALEVDEQIISNKIRNDLEVVQELSTVYKDPVGYAVYLYFLLKNKRRSVEVDNLIDWLNSWVENILVKRNFSRFIDRELASSLFAHFSLRKFERLTVNVRVQDLTQLFNEYIEDEHFFNNFTLSSLIALALADFKDEIEEYSNLWAWIEKQVDAKNVFNDAKNLVFTSILFENVDSKDGVKKVFDYCYDRLLRNIIPYYDQLFYAYVMWKFRSLKERKEDLQKIREFADESLENAMRVMLKEEEECSEEIYGVDTQKARSQINASKIYLGVFIDLLNDFRKGTIRVSKDELTRKEISPWISLGSLLSAIIFLSGISVTWAAFQLTPMIDFSVLSKDPILIKAAKFATNGMLFALTVLMLVTSGSLFWDTVSKRIGNTQLIKGNLKSRLKKYVWLGVAISLIFEFLKIFFGI